MKDRILLIILTLIFTNSLTAQRIKVDEIDKFTKYRRLETSVSWVKRSITCGIGFYFRSNDDYIVLSVKGYTCGANVIGKGDELQFLLDNDETVIVKSVCIQGYEISYGSGGNAYYHDYEIKLSDLKQLADHKVKSFRKFAGNKYEDFNLSRGNQTDIADNAKVFLKAYEK